ncbi:MAG: hypothetical protein VKO39_01265 [Cyanobacteriota bacterium]|nr:hypothetical protein [Cyanobacteriota bacterium]
MSPDDSLINSGAADTSNPFVDYALPDWPIFTACYSSISYTAPPVYCCSITVPLVPQATDGEIGFDPLDASVDPLPPLTGGIDPLPPGELDSVIDGGIVEFPIDTPTEEGEIFAGSTRGCWFPPALPVPEAEEAGWVTTLAIGEEAGEPVDPQEIWLEPNPAADGSETWSQEATDTEGIAGFEDVFWTKPAPTESVDRPEDSFPPFGFEDPSTEVGVAPTDPGSSLEGGAETDPDGVVDPEYDPDQPPEEQAGGSDWGKDDSFVSPDTVSCWNDGFELPPLGIPLTEPLPGDSFLEPVAWSSEPASEEDASSGGGSDDGISSDDSTDKSLEEEQIPLMTTMAVGEETGAVSLIPCLPPEFATGEDPFLPSEPGQEGHGEQEPDLIGVVDPILGDPFVSEDPGDNAAAPSDGDLASDPGPTDFADVDLIDDDDWNADSFDYYDYGSDYFCDYDYYDYNYSGESDFFDGSSEWISDLEFSEENASAETGSEDSFTSDVENSDEIIHATLSIISGEKFSYRPITLDNYSSDVNFIEGDEFRCYDNCVYQDSWYDEATTGEAFTSDPFIDDPAVLPTEELQTGSVSEEISPEADSSADSVEVISDVIPHPGITTKAFGEESGSGFDLYPYKQFVEEDFIDDSLFTFIVELDVEEDSSTETIFLTSFDDSGEVDSGEADICVLADSSTGNENAVEGSEHFADGDVYTPPVGRGQDSDGVIKPWYRTLVFKDVSESGILYSLSSPESDDTTVTTPDSSTSSTPTAAVPISPDPTEVVSTADPGASSLPSPTESDPLQSVANPEAEASPVAPSSNASVGTPALALTPVESPLPVAAAVDSDPVTSSGGLEGVNPGSSLLEDAGRKAPNPLEYLGLPLLSSSS